MMSQDYESRFAEPNKHIFRNTLIVVSLAILLVACLARFAFAQVDEGIGLDSIDPNSVLCSGEITEFNSYNIRSASFGEGCDPQTGDVYAIIMTSGELEGQTLVITIIEPYGCCWSGAKISVDVGDWSNLNEGDTFDAYDLSLRTSCGLSAEDPCFSYVVNLCGNSTTTPCYIKELDKSVSFGLAIIIGLMFLFVWGMFFNFMTLKHKK